MCRQASAINRHVLCQHVLPQPIGTSNHPVTKADVQDFARNSVTQCRYNLSSITQQIFHTMLVLQVMTTDFSYHLQEMREMMQAFNTSLDRLEQKIEQRLAYQDEKSRPYQSKCVQLSALVHTVKCFDLSKILLSLTPAAAVSRPAVPLSSPAI
jgi:hypothetical protein